MKKIKLFYLHDSPYLFSVQLWAGETYTGICRLVKDARDIKAAAELLLTGERSTR